MKNTKYIIENVLNHLNETSGISSDLGYVRSKKDSVDLQKKIEKDLKRIFGSKMKGVYVDVAETNGKAERIFINDDKSPERSAVAIESDYNRMLSNLKREVQYHIDARKEYD